MQPTKILADENYLLGGKVPLIDLIDACNAFLDNLDIRYSITEEVDDEKETDSLLNKIENTNLVKLEVNSKG